MVETCYLLNLPFVGWEINLFLTNFSQSGQQEIYFKSCYPTTVYAFNNLTCPSSERKAVANARAIYAIL
jgi:hypothetical protein